MASTSTDEHQMSNRRLDDRYELRQRVGSGGMAEVWEGFDHTLSRRIAIKMLHSHLAADPTVLARFRSEAQAAARLTHPAIVAIYDTVSAEDNDAIVMEFVEGRDLRTILNERPTLAAADAVEVGLQLADALGHAHQNGIVHRDVKPANILVRPDRRVKLSDFGIAKALDEVGHTETGSLVGTVKYLAPEQIEGHMVDGRTDLYALSTVLYEMLCGKVPFSATDLMGAMERLRKPPPFAREIRPDLPIALDEFLQKGLSRKPDDRYEDAAAWSAALKTAMLGGLVVERGDPTIVESKPEATSIPLSTSEPTQAIPTTKGIPKASPRPPVVSAPATAPAASTEAAGQDVWSTELPPARPTAKQRAKADPGTAKHVKRSRSRVRWLGPLISLLLMLAAVATVWFLLTDAGDSIVERFSGSDDTATVEETNDAQDDVSEVAATNTEDEDQEPEPVETAETEPADPVEFGDFDGAGIRATSFDPSGDGEEHEEAVSRPFDGDPDTFWFTEQYRDRTFGQIKEGVGLIVEFAEPRPIQDLVIEADRQGWAFDLYTAEVAADTLAGWGEPIGSFTELGPSEVLDVDDREVTSLLVWVTDLGIDPEQTIEEYDAVVESGEIDQQLRIAQLELVG